MFDDHGHVVGVMVGIGESDSGSQYIALAVPSPVVCKARDYLGLK